MGWLSYMAAWLVPFFLAVVSPDTLRAPAPADSAAPSSRVVRQFPPIEVRAPLPDPRSSETVRTIDAARMASLPGGQLVDVLVLQPGVVVQAGEAHVRGGRAGELAVSLDGGPFNEPLRGRSLELPRLAIQ